MNGVKAAVYALLVIFATTAGALTGMGGGVIIKPVLDILNDYDAASINLLSGTTVLIMSTVSLARYRRRAAGSTLHIPLAAALALGAVLGGALGQWLFGKMLAAVNNSVVIRVQNSILIILILLVFLCLHRQPGAAPPYRRHPAAGLSAGCVLGLLSTFLGIGGGPFNVAAMLLIFGWEAKEAVPYSLFIIFFSQLSKLVAVVAGGGLSGCNLHMLPVMAVAAVAGGTLGARLNHRLSNRQVTQGFNAMQVLILCLCLVNIARTLL